MTNIWNDKKQGIFFVILSGFCFSMMSFLVRIAGDLPTMQKAFFRNAVAVFIAFFMLIKKKENAYVPQKGDLPNLFARCAFGVVGIICNFYAIDHMNISDANILNKLSPFFAIVMSVFILKEKATRRQLLSVVVAFVGALFVVKPSFSSQFLHAMVGMLGGFAAGTAYTFVRKLGKRGVPGAWIVLCFSLFSTIVCFPFLFIDASPMEPAQILSLTGAGLSAAGGQFAITAAYTKAPAGEISVFDYTQVIFSAILGFLFLRQIPDLYSILGYFIIIGIAIWNASHYTGQARH